MPDVTPIPFTSRDIIKGSGVVRSSGPGIIHLTQIRDDLGRTIGAAGCSHDEGPDNGWDLELAGEIGFLWEDVISLAFRNRIVAESERPGEIEHEGIVMSPDGVNYAAWELDEYKATWRSSKESLRDDPGAKTWKWFVQVKSYCYALDMDTVNFKILYLCGDWNRANYKGPEVKAYRVRFLQSELKENWKMIKDHAKLRGWL